MEFIVFNDIVILYNNSDYGKNIDEKKGPRKLRYFIRRIKFESSIFRFRCCRAREVVAEQTNWNYVCKQLCR